MVPLPIVLSAAPRFGQLAFEGSAVHFEGVYFYTMNHNFDNELFINGLEGCPSS